ncbi:hypothetical protein UlMin_020390 [Ulmus minor]
MALAKERSIFSSHDSCMIMSSSTVHQLSAGFEADEHNNKAGLDQEKSSSGVNSFGVVFQGGDGQLEDAQSVINFKGYNGFLANGESLLSFEQNQRANSQNSSNWDSPNLDQSYPWNLIKIPRFSSDYNCFQTASDYSSLSSTTSKGNQNGDGSYGWLYSEEKTVAAESFEESGIKEPGFNKRPNMGENTQALKKQCTSTTKKPSNTKQKSSPAKDPQSIAAKNRRERISERLKILQELVPNGSKVDLVTMLEKAISYVKFLQLQVKVLATDEFWPVQGGKAPDISQVKEAIDSILSSQRDRKSSST